jgi:hypothetical protein
VADNRVAEAIEIVAREVARRALDSGYATAPERANYPEVGERDWNAITLILDRWRDEFYDVPVEAFEAAYQFLDQRADAE